MSRRHCRLFFENDQLMIEDLDSHNGTRVNGRAVYEPTPVDNNCQVEMGESCMSVTGLLVEGSTAGRTRRDVRESRGGRERSIYVSAEGLLRESEMQSQPPGKDPASSRIIERLKMLNEAHKILAHALDSDELLDSLIQWVSKHMSPEEAAIFLADEGGDLATEPARFHSNRGEIVGFSSHLAEEVVSRRQAALVYDTEVDERFTGADSIIASGIRSLIAAPMSAEDHVFGMIVLNARGARPHFTEEDMEVLVSIAAIAAMRMRNLILAERAAHQRRMEEELSLARRIQMRLLPSGFPVVDGYEIYGENIPSQQVSGDFFQVLERDEGRECVMVIADVSGKGVAASLLTASLEALSASPIEDGLPPDAICRKLSRMMVQRTPPEKYATLFLAVLNRESGRLDYCNAGHNPALILSPDNQIAWLENTGLPIGMMRKDTHTLGSRQLDHGDMMVLYTDGLTEARNLGGEEFGMDRLATVCQTHPKIPLEDLAGQIHLAIREFSGHQPNMDDQTLLMLRRK